MADMYWRAGSPPLKARVASALYWMLDHLCAWMDHAGACWLLVRSPLKRLWWWAADYNIDRWRHAEWGWAMPVTSDSACQATVVIDDGSWWPPCDE